MAAPTTVTYGGLDLNDGLTYTLMDGFDPGERVKTSSEYRGLNGTVAQYNVSEANVIEMHVPLLVQGTDNASLTAAVAAINAIVDGGPAVFVYNDGGGEVTYSCVYSNRVGYVRNAESQIAFRTRVNLILNRTP